MDGYLHIFILIKLIFINLKPQEGFYYICLYRLQPVKEKLKCHLSYLSGVACSTEFSVAH